MRNEWWGLVVAAVAVGSARADLYEFVFRGTIDSVGGAAPAPVGVGDDFEFRYRFDAGWSDSDGAPNVGKYLGAMYVSWVTIGSEAWHQTFPGDVFVLNDGFAGDSYTASTTGPISLAAVNMTNLGGAAFDGDMLPINLHLPDWGIRSFTFQWDVGPTSWSASGEIAGFESRLAPAPGALALAWGALVARRRRP
ncbi:MAG: hypothetical protein DYG94_04730 [Leptolyngbya sp. PLA3]|nr:MAG: hypothetical protein EDM82_03880 [Cyanobacteria bacterium CYA]MCE7968037.1 hypothetical protein [Leptolyngbya sp. PL-A3]